MPMILTKDEVHRFCSILEPEIRESAHKRGLPYIPLIPSLRAYTLIRADWDTFEKVYHRSVIVAAHSGQNFAYID